MYPKKVTFISLALDAVKVAGTELGEPLGANHVAHTEGWPIQSNKHFAKTLFSETF